MESRICLLTQAALALCLTAGIIGRATAQDNTAVGAGALVSNTVGVGNEAFGGNALYRNTVGNENVADGYAALSYNTVGSYNIAIGSYALLLNTTGNYNAASGYKALYFNTTGNYNNAVGYTALENNTTGAYNSGIGAAALYLNTTGAYNSAAGDFALYNNSTGGYNNAQGYGALIHNTTGFYNAAMGVYALYSNTVGNNNLAMGQLAGYYITGSNNIDIGSKGSGVDNAVIRIGTPGVQTTSYIAGVSGVNVTGGATVVVNASGQLGVMSSSRRYKEDIRSMGDVSGRLLKLRPVTFRYKKADDNGQKPEQYGLIAEEVAQVMPELVVYNNKGQPETVAYQTLAPLLLNELQREHRQVAALKAEVSELRRVTTQLAATRGLAMGDAQPDSAVKLPQ
jgi:trimeric autotransporter adhesin